MAAAAVRQASDILVVPPDKRSVLLRQRDDVFLQSQDGEYWCRPSRVEDSLMCDFLSDNYAGAPKRFWTARVGTRLGYNNSGLFIHEDHHKRYFGLDNQKASAALMHGLDQPVPRVNAKGEKLAPGTETDQILGKMLHSLPSLSDDMRYKVLHASFERADRNKNGTLSRPELGIILRRVVNTLTTNDVEEIMREVDKDGDGAINYNEFVGWLQRESRPKFASAFCASLQNEADIVRATFRMWDKNGNGLVPNRCLIKALCRVHPDQTETQVQALVKCMDCDHDGNIDYDEFVDFLFHRSTKSIGF